MSTGLNILYIGNKLSAHGGTPTSIETLGPLLEGEGHMLYYASDKKAKLNRLADMLSSISRHRRIVDVVLIDTYSTSAFYFAWLCSRLCNIYRIPYIPVLRGGDLPRRLKKSVNLCKQVFGNSCANISVSAYLEHHMIQSGFRCRTIPNNIELGKYPFRQRSEIKPRLLWVRAFHKTYNPTMAVEVAERLVKIYPGVQLTMVGPEMDGSMEVCKNVSKERGLESNISFTGRLSKEEWAKLSEEHDVFINTTDYDNLPVSVIEAMALGLPVVSTNVGGVPFLIANEKNGLLVERGDSEAMANNIIKLLTDNEKAEKLSIAAREKAMKYDWEHIRFQWQQLFAGLK